MTDHEQTDDEFDDKGAALANLFGHLSREKLLRLLDQHAQLKNDLKTARALMRYGRGE